MQCSSFQCFDENVLSQDVNTDTDTYTKGFKSNFQRGQKSHKNPLTLESQTPNSPPCDMTDLVAGITCVPSPTLPQDPFALLLLSNCSNSSQYSVLVVCFLCVCACADALEEKKSPCSQTEKLENRLTRAFLLATPSPLESLPAFCSSVHTVAFFNRHTHTHNYTLVYS